MVTPQTQAVLSDPQASLWERFDALLSDSVLALAALVALGAVVGVCLAYPVRLFWLPPLDEASSEARKARDWRLVQCEFVGGFIATFGLTLMYLAGISLPHLFLAVVLAVLAGAGTHHAGIVADWFWKTALPLAARAALAWARRKLGGGEEPPAAPP